ncbi:MAG TPA: GNAT family N-acetyltransferase [Clostridiales bacterium]|nr:GNAT family N-acetyltransferase [Clostridiales bacterium]
MDLILKAYETERLTLRTLNKDFAYPVLSFYEENKENFEPWEPARNMNFYTLPYQKASLTAEYNQMAEGKLLRLWAFLKNNPEEIIGSVCFQNFLREPYQSCTMGYKVSYKYQHQGYALESIQKGIDIIFQELHFHRIEAYIMPENKSSLHVIEKLHFHQEGLARSYARVQGAWRDHRRYALINPFHC